MQTHPEPIPAFILSMFRKVHSWRHPWLSARYLHQIWRLHELLVFRRLSVLDPATSIAGILSRPAGGTSEPPLIVSVKYKCYHCAMVVDWLAIICHFPFVFKRTSVKRILCE